ncbi:hypothetical protein Cfor_07290, partial [Coptotermes formosanus]
FCVVLLLVCYALAMPTGHDVAETLSTTESLQKAETPNKPTLGQEPSAGVFAGRLYLPPTPAARDYRSVEAVHQDNETPSPTFPNAQDSELADDILDGRKAVVEVDFFRSSDNDNDEEGARKQHSAGGITSGDKPESTSATAVTEPQSKFSENTESSSQNPEDKNVSGGQRDVRSFDSNNHNVHDEDTTEDEDDMAVAETIIFRPLFSYRQDTAARRRYFREVSRNEPGFDYY